MVTTLLFQNFFILPNKILSLLNKNLPFPSPTHSPWQANSVVSLNMTTRKWQLTPVFLPGKFHEQRSLVGYNPWHHKELDTTEWLNNKVSHVSGIIRYLSFCAWFLSLNIMFSRFIHVIDNVRSSSFYDWIILHCTDEPHLLYPFIYHWTFRLSLPLGYGK